MPGKARDRHNTLMVLMAAPAFVGGLGRVLSIAKVGLPEPHALWICSLVPELVVPWIIIAGQVMTTGRRGGAAGVEAKTVTSGVFLILFLTSFDRLVSDVDRNRKISEASAINSQIFEFAYRLHSIAVSVTLLQVAILSGKK